MSLRSYEKNTGTLITNNTSMSVEADVSSHDELSTGFLRGINGCSIGIMTDNFSGFF